MGERLRWAIEWAWFGSATALLAPCIVTLSLQIDMDYPVAASILGGISGFFVGLLVEHLFRQLSPRSRVALLWVSLPVPLGLWGALVASGAALLAAQQFVAPAFFAGSFVAICQLFWFVPLYVSGASSDSPLRPIALVLVLIFALPVGLVSIIPVMFGLGVWTNGF